MTDAPSGAGPGADGRRVAALAPDPGWLPALEGAAPKFVAGLARVSDVILRDGALPSASKALFAAAICAVKRDAALADHWLTSAARAGVPRAHAEGASVGLLISRGVTPHALFVAALERAYAGAGAGGAGDAAGVDGGGGEDGSGFAADVPGAYDYFRRYFGFVPDYVELLGDRVADGLAGYFLMREAALAETALPARDMELLLCAVNAAEYQARFVAIHARGARRAGADERQLVEAALTAMPFAGVASWLPAAQGILDSRDVAADGAPG